MKTNDIIRIHDEQASEYDQQVREYKEFGHDVLFGMSFEYVNPHERLLDIGIGTGLSSQAFAKAGLDIFGIDGSVEMLNICKSKGFVKELKIFDLQSGPLPYTDGFFNHAISCGVLHFFGDLKPLFREVFRVMKPGGIFAFTNILQISGRDEEVESYSESSAFGAEATVFLHAGRYIEELLQCNGFDKVKEFIFLASSGMGDLHDLLCEAYVARRLNIRYALQQYVSFLKAAMGKAVGHMERSPLKYGRVFDDEDFAEKYAKKHKGMAEKFGREYSEKLSSRGFQKGRILDAGCGFGWTDIILAQRFPDSEVVGIDLSEPLLRRANQAAQSADLGKRVKFEKADVQRIPYADDSFDVVLNINMVHLVEDPVRMLDEIERVLVPHGFLFVADLRRSWAGLIEREIKSALTLEEARDLFSRSKLREGIFSRSFIWWRFET